MIVYYSIFQGRFYFTCWLSICKSKHIIEKKHLLSKTNCRNQNEKWKILLSSLLKNTWDLNVSIENKPQDGDLIANLYFSQSKCQIYVIYCTWKCEITNHSFSHAIKSGSGEEKKKKVSLKMRSIYGLRSDLTLLSILHFPLTGKPYR